VERTERELLLLDQRANFVDLFHRVARVVERDGDTIFGNFNHFYQLDIDAIFGNQLLQNVERFRFSDRSIAFKHQIDIV